MKKVQQGFTLIELMIVVAIIGILAAIAIPAYSDYLVRTKWADTLSSVASVKTGINECMDNNDYDTTACDTNGELAEYGVDSTIATTKYGVAPVVGTSAIIQLDGSAISELGSCDVDLTPNPKSGFTEWTPVTSATCVKFVKGASTAAG
jgi:type IV pilus assembly protein PilA